MPEGVRGVQPLLDLRASSEQSLVGCQISLFGADGAVRRDALGGRAP